MTEMTMDVHQESKIKGSQETAQIIKGKRTKRQRPASPLVLAITSTSSSAGESSPLSPVSSVEFAESNITVGEEEEDMANCLILLAQGHHQAAAGKSSEPAAAADLPTTGSSSSKLGHQRLYVYQCKTCNRCFPSFQALGGHRASHKKPTNKANNEEKKEDSEEDHHQRRSSNNINIVSTTLSLQMAEEKGLCSSTVKSNKVHECSICGAEFSSGQALGGHMRRHRAIATTATSSTATVSLGRISPDESQESKKPRNSQQLDLNLPAAPEDDLQETKFPFESNKQVLIFSASALVDCHY